jgi:hypothetical protein
MKPINWKELGSDTAKIFIATTFILGFAGLGPFAIIGAAIITVIVAIFIIAIQTNDPPHLRE